MTSRQNLSHANNITNDPYDEPLPDSLSSASSENLDLNIDHELDLDNVVVPNKPHFLDLNAEPPPGFDENSIVVAAPISKSESNKNVDSAEILVDKKFERDGEISDYELAASGFAKKEISNPTLHLMESRQSLSIQHKKKKHFLDENPIPPNYMVVNKLIQSDDKQSEQQSCPNIESQQDLSTENYGKCIERKHSIERVSRSRRPKEPSFTLSRFIESDFQNDKHHGTWPAMERNEIQMNYNSMPNDIIPQNLGPKVECIYSLLSMLGSHDSSEMSRKFLDLSRTPETCTTLRRSGCIPILVQMMHSNDSNDQVRKRASHALHNVVHCHPDDKAGRREAKVLRLIEQIMDYCNFLKTLLQSGGEAIADDADRHPLPAISSLMKVSFDEEHRHAMCQLGALQAIASLVHLDHATHGPKPENQCCNSLRRYALMALTNLTFGDGNNKANLCANKDFMEALVAQLESAPDDLLQVTASVLRNLSWRADNNMKSVLNEIGTVTALVIAAMINNKNENTLKAILSALWNLSAHCSTNKAEFCSVEGALAFLVDMLTYEGPSKTLKIIENAGGILRNVSSHIAVREDYRIILRQKNCLGILLQQLKSESLTVVSNACGTLWNLSARSPEDQKYLWDNGAVPMLRSLIHSKHKMISEGSSAALKNLLNFRPGVLNQSNLDPIAKSMNLKQLPSLNVRKQKALENELNSNLAETCDNLDVVTPPKEKKDFIPASELIFKHNTVNNRLTRSVMLSKSESRDSILSAQSDSVYENLRRGNSAPPQAKTYPRQSKSLNFTVRPGNPYQDDPQITDEHPVDYSAKFSENDVIKVTTKSPKKNKKTNGDNGNYNTTCQETDLDQPTNFSLRYAEKNEVDKPPQIEDSVKCYQTEDTPYISNAASITDLQKTEEIPVQHQEQNPPKRIAHPKRITISKDVVRSNNVIYGSGTYTPEKPINYCEEGTPGYFSRYESSSSLDDLPNQNMGIINSSNTKAKPQTVQEESIQSPLKQPTEINEATQVSPRQLEKVDKLSSTLRVEGIGVCNQKINVNSAQETPLMFSRRSSMDSLTGEVEEPLIPDDKSSVVSDFSRLASGVISPSELPDSPTQSMPQSPRRQQQIIFDVQSTQPKTTEAQPRLRSVFEDEFSTFQVENTPAQFSSATSLSNLSIEDDENEPKIATDSQNKEISLVTSLNKKYEPNFKAESPQKRKSVGLSEGEDEDDDVLAAAIHIGMTRSQNKLINQSELHEDSTKQYCTENTPALLSKVGSSSNLSILSTQSGKENSDLSSNASECAEDLLEQCIKDGIMTKSGSTTVVGATVKSGKNNENAKVAGNLSTSSGRDPIEMLRRGGQLPSYLQVKDEMYKFLVEDSPCTFSVMSGLSGLTIEDGITAGPATFKKISEHLKNPNDSKTDIKKEGRFKNQDDSLSSISIESEDDSNLLSQAIAAGSRPKSNLGNNSLSIKKTAPQLIPTTSEVRQNLDGNDSVSSIDSSDNDQSKSLLEQCIRTGMTKKTKSMQKVLEPQQSPTKRNSQLPMLLQQRTTPAQKDRDRQRERERKDEQLLKECINFGINKKLDLNDQQQQQQQIRPPVRHMRQVLQPTEFNQRLVSTQQQQSQPKFVHPNQEAKNGDPTSAVVLEQHHLEEHIISKSAPNAVPDVGMLRESPEGTPNRNSIINTSIIDLKRPQENITTRTQTIGSENFQIFEFIQNKNNSTPLDQSNEYPAILNISDLSNKEFNNQNFNDEMELSNEFLIGHDDVNSLIESKITKTLNLHLELDTESVSSGIDSIQDKHKDPDLMLKSVDRLTLQLVSTAEYLRTNGSREEFIVNTATIKYKDGDDDEDDDESGGEKKSDSNNTWNEDTCPNDDISFPSISMTAPIIASYTTDSEAMSDKQVNETDLKILVEVTPTNEQESELTSFNYVSSQPNSLETETDTLVMDEETDVGGNSSNGSGVQFKVGGEVKQSGGLKNFNAYNSGLLSFEISAATMTQSTIIAIEANKLANNLLMTDSATSLDLDHIRPPSCMDSLSGCFDTGPHSMGGTSSVPQSPQLSRLRKKSLPAGLMAKRALGCIPLVSNHGGSLESIQSNLDNVKPPSIMDELLDSMISVDSITSEIVDINSFCNGGQTTGLSNYETAFNDDEDDASENTTTLLQSCLDVLPLDGMDSAGTPIPSDFSSAESTPRKSSSNNKNLNTTSSHYLQALSNSSGCGGVRRLLTPKQRRRFIKDRYKTYTVAADFVLKESFSGTEFPDDIDNDEIISIEFRSQSQEKNCGEENIHINASDSIKSETRSPTSARRRNLDPDRFKTRTIIYNSETTGANCSQASKTQLANASDFSSLTSTDDDSDEISSIRAMTKNFKFITQPEPNKLENSNQLSLAAIKNQYLRSKLLEGEHQRSDIRITGAESDYNSMEFCDQNSETESCDQNIGRTPIDNHKDLESNKTVKEASEVQPQKSRIIKPNDKDSGTDLNYSEDALTPPELKPIRGRKKTAYVSPYKKSVLSNSSTRTTSPKPQIIRTNLASKNTEIKKVATNSKYLLPNKTPKTQYVLLNKTTLTSKINALKTGITRPGFTSNASSFGKKKDADKNISNNKKVGVGSQVKKSENKVPDYRKQNPNDAISHPLLERQGTFVKDEPSNSEVPIVGSLPTSPSKSSKLPMKLGSKPNGTQSSKSPAKTIKPLQNPIQKSASMGTYSKMKLPLSRPNSGTVTPQMVSSPGETFSTQKTVTEKRKSLIGVRKCPSVPSVTNRSGGNTTTSSVRQSPLQSTEHLSSTQPPSRSNSTLTSQKLSQITSRISGIWKRIDEVKQKNCTSTNKSSAAPNSSVAKPPSGSQNKTLIRSSTFDNSPQPGTTATTSKKFIGLKRIKN